MLEKLFKCFCGKKSKKWTAEDEASAESFPASDPPAWTTGKKDEVPKEKDKDH